MAWTELKERSGEGSMAYMKSLLKETKENIMELCEMIESMEGSSYGERGMYGDREGYGERDAWRIERERRGKRSY